MKTRSILGWVILLGALAVPAVLFQRWWTQLKQPATFTVQQKGVPPGGAFGDARSDQAGSLGNPIQPPPGAAPPAGPGQAALPPRGMDRPAPPAMNGSAYPGDSGSASPAPPARGGAFPPGTSGPPSGMGTTPAASQGSPSGSAGRNAAAPLQDRPPKKRVGKAAIEYRPKSSRDPMLSLADLRAIAKEKYAKELARREMIEASRPKPKAKKAARKTAKPKTDACKKLDLQGIVSTPTGSGAIVNDEVRYQGDSIFGLTIKRITTRTVVFAQGRRTACVKRVSR